MVRAVAFSGPPPELWLLENIRSSNPIQSQRFILDAIWSRATASKIHLLLPVSVNKLSCVGTRAFFGAYRICNLVARGSYSIIASLRVAPSNDESNGATYTLCFSGCLAGLGR